MGDGLKRARAATKATRQSAPIPDADVTVERMYYTLCRRCGAALDDWSDTPAKARANRKTHLAAHVLAEDLLAELEPLDPDVVAAFRADLANHAQVTSEFLWLLRDMIASRKQKIGAS